MPRAPEFFQTLSGQNFISGHKFVMWFLKSVGCGGPSQGAQY